ncbi:MAG: HAD family hydrolase [Chloroflexota bacterium]
MAPNKLVLLDIDGTLLIGAGSGRMATELAMREVFGTSGKLADYTFGGKTDFYTLVELLSPEGFTEAQIAETLPHYSTVLVGHMSNIIGNYEIHALPGALELVDALAAHPDVLLGLITGNVLPMAELKLRTVGIDPARFAIAAYGTEARIRRELVPLVLVRAEQRSGSHFAPRDVIFVGDTVDDIDCAHSIGGHIFAVATGNTPRAVLEQHPPVTVLDNLSDIQTLLSLMFSEGS